jgi:uncharacterized protein involved in exopolysaccharide biosynthesis
MKKESLSKASRSAEHLTPTAEYHRESSEAGDITPVVALTAVLRNRHLLLGCAFAGAVLFATRAWLKPETYTVTSVLMPQGPKAPTGFVGLASQVGISIPGTQDNLQLYADLLKSREILRAVAERSYTFGTENGVRTSTLVDLYGGSAQEPFRMVLAVRRLAEQVSAAPSPKTGVITVQVKAEYAQLSHQVAQQLIDQLNRFNLEQRQSQAGAERKFAERRLTEAREELRTAENQLESFLAQNREFRTSPRLAFEQDRLAREIALRQQVYNMLAQAYEQSKMDEIRDTPVITIIEPPETPLMPDARGLRKNAVFGLVFGLVVAILIAVVREYSGRQRLAESEELRDFDRLKAEAWYEVKHPWTFFTKGLWRKRMA